MKYLVTVNKNTYAIEINDENHIIVDKEEYELDFKSIGNGPLYSLLINGKSYEGYVEVHDNVWQVQHQGNLYSVEIDDERSKRLMSLGGATAVTQGDYYLKSPMPGMVVSVPVTEGQVISEGDILVVLESMKMQNELKSPSDGIVSRVQVSSEDAIQQDQVMLVLSPEHNDEHEKK